MGTSMVLDRTKLGGEHRAPQLQRQRSPHDSFTSWGGLRPSSNGDEVRLRVLLLGRAFASDSCLASSTTRAMASSTCEALNRTESLADAVTRQERGGLTGQPPGAQWRMCGDW